jgi:hypothetical protein
MSSAPGGVPAGSGGLVDDGGLPLPLLGVSLGGLLLATVAGLRLSARRG